MNVYYIDQTSLIDEGFIYVLESIVKSGDAIEIVYDSSVSIFLDIYGKLDQDKFFYLKTILNYLYDSNIGRCIDASDFCEGSVLKNDLEKYDQDIYLISQRSSTFNIFEEILKDRKNFYEFQIENGKLFKRNYNENIKVKPFYIENDIYVNKINTNNIDYVFSPKYSFLKLFRNHVNSGGEGTCYPSYKGLYCKIFNEKHLTYVNYKKIQYMLEMNIDNEYLAWPKDLLFYNGDFVGYAMQYVTGAKSITSLKDEGFVQYKSPLDRAKICLAFLKNIKYLHDRNILVCDIKDDNILIKNCDEVYIIDCGSFQVHDFACDVVTKGWTDKEYHKNDLNTTLRTIDEEYYPINRLLFELMVLKNPYYSLYNIEVDNDEHMDFRFPLDISGITKDSPPYLIAWALLSDRIREFFYYFFKNPTNRKIIYIDEWINEFKLLIKTYEEYSRR